MNWLIFAVFGLVLSIGMILSERRKLRALPPPSTQEELVFSTQMEFAYLILVVSVIGILISLELSFAAAMLSVVGVTGTISLIDWGILKRKRDPLKSQPDWVYYSKSFFPVILVVFTLRSFLVEPFQIPSSSMRPGLVVGDFILVNKFTYGIRLPISNQVMIPMNKPTNGDVMVFHFPLEPTKDYIKRVIGIAGDRIVYKNKRLFINGKPLETKPAGMYEYHESPFSIITTTRLEETLQAKPHAIITDESKPSVELLGVRAYPMRDHCAYNEEGFSCTVPPGYYFMMGDNRDNSFDSRYWGFVSDDYVVGKAFFIWLNWQDMSRIGTIIH